MHRSILVSTPVVLWALLLPILSAHVVHAEPNDDLTRAIARFDAQAYLDAQEILVGIDPAELDEDHQKQRTDYLERIQTALTMNEKSLRNLDDAHVALGDGDPDRARSLAEAVLANEYATDSIRGAAEGLLARLGTAKPSQANGDDDVEEPEEPARSPEEPSAPPEAVERARTLTRAGNDYVRDSRYEEAAQAFQDALAAVPGYPEAVDGLRRVRQHVENIDGARAESLIEQIRRNDRINWQRAVAEYRDVEATIRTQVGANQYDEARKMLVRARQIVESARQFADPISRYESLKSESEALSSWVQDEERRYNESKVAEIRRQIEQERAARLRQDDENRKRQVEALMSQAMQHRKDGELDQAIAVLDQIIVIAPKDRTARWMRDELEDVRQDRGARRDRAAFYEETQKALQDVEQAKIPWHLELQYPDNWPELTARPERLRPSELAGSRQLFGALKRRVPVDFHGLPFDQVIERLVDAQRVNIIVNWHDLKSAGVKRDVPIDLSIPNEITLQKALTEVLEQAGGGEVELGFSVGDGTLKIATQRTLDKETYTAVYDIQDLLMEIPNFTDAPTSDLTHTYRRAGRARAQQQESPWRSGDDDDDEQEDNPERNSRVKKIIELIQDTVAPDSWVTRGGTVGTINEINGQLVITQNSSSQRAIGNLLGKLREQRAIQIAVEARFVTVSSHYLEELGVDIDVLLNAGNAGFDFLQDPNGGGVLTDPVLGTPVLLPRSLSRVGVTPTAPQGQGSTLTTNPANLQQPFRQPGLIPRANGASGSQATPIPISTNFLSLTNPANLGSDIPGSFAGQTIAPAFSLFGSFLDNIQVDFLIRATQADSRTSVLTAPRLVLFNGQRSWVAVTIQQGFVSQLTPVVGTGAVAQAPQTGVIDSGAVLDVTATVSADKRYVTMTIRPGITRLLALQTIPFSGGSGGGGFGGGAATPAFIQLPTLSSQRVQTTVSIPDGGTLLVGGQKLASETEVEAGVPILSKIPILKRAYSSRSMVKDEQTLLILIKPKVFIQTEQEELAFPSFRGG